ncbi:MAG: hypothetical protein HZR80_02980 [Candidatus Heimdallarchaeota archaeon]
MKYSKSRLNFSNLIILCFVFASSISSKTNLLSGYSCSIIESSLLYPQTYEYEEIGQYDDNLGYAWEVIIQDNKAYLADGSAGLVIFDITNTNSPIVIGQFSDGGETTNIFVKDHFAFLVDSQDDLEIINITNPKTPLLLSKYSFPDNMLKAVHIQENYAYLAYRTYGMIILDISNLSSPTKVGEYLKDNTRDIFVNDSYAYLSGYDYALEIVNITNPFNPERVGEWGITGDCWGLDIQGNYAYLALRTVGLYILDISDPTNPFYEGDFAGTDYYRVFLEGNYAYISSLINEAVIIDISDPSNPFEEGYFASFFPWGIYVSNDIAYLAAKENFTICDITDKENPAVIYNLFQGGEAISVDVNGNYAYIVDSKEGLEIIDINNPANPFEVGQYDEIGFRDVVVIGNYAYLVDFDRGLTIIDISNKNVPIKVSEFYEGHGQAFGLYINGNIAYLANGHASLEIIDITDSTNPIKISNYDTGSNVYDVFVRDNYVYIATLAGLTICEITNSVDLSFVSELEYECDWIKKIFSTGNYTFITGETDGLTIINTRNPINPTILVSNFGENSHSLNNVYYYNKYLLLSDETKGMLVYDFINSIDFTQIGQFYDNGDSTFCVQVVGSNAYIADGFDGLEIVLVDSDKDGIFDGHEPNETSNNVNQYRFIDVIIVGFVFIPMIHILIIKKKRSKKN